MQLWGHRSDPYWPTYTLNTLKGWPSQLPLVLPGFWLRYVDDAFVIQQEEHKQTFLEHINNVDPAIKFNVENNQQDGAIPFLDIIVKPQADNTLSLTVYRKHTHTQTNIFSGTGTIIWQPKFSVISTPTQGLGLFVLNQNSSTRNTTPQGGTYQMQVS